MTPTIKKWKKEPNIRSIIDNTSQISYVDEKGNIFMQ